MHVPKTKPKYACDMCSYNAIHEYDLRRHKNTMHGIKSSCNQCEYKTESLHDLKMHIRNEHVNTRTYFASRRSPTSTKFQDTSGHNTNAETSASASPSTSNLFHCHGPCSSLEKTFDHEDELNLHMQYYHTETQ